MSGVDLSFDYAGLAYGPGDAGLLLCALVLDAVFGIWPGLRSRVPHPALLLAALICELSRRLNRQTRGSSARMMRGVVLLAIAVGAAAIIGRAVDLFAGVVPFFWLAGLALITALTVLRGPFDEAGRVTSGFTEGALPGARSAAADIIGPKAETLNPADFVRAIIEHMAGRLADGLAAGVFWYLLLGLPGLLVLRAINIAGRLLDENKADVGVFGLVPTRLNEAIGYLPAFLSGLVVVLAAAFVPGCNPLRALAALVANGQRSGRLSEGPAIAAFSGAMSIGLGGRLFGPASEEKLLDGASGAEIVRAQYLYAVSALLIFAAVVILTALRYAL